MTTGAAAERLYSAAARMLTAQGSPTWRDEHWPEERRLAWRGLERVLEAGGSDTGPGDPPDPARDLVTVRLGFPAAVRMMREYLRDDPDGVDEPVVVPAVTHTAVTVSLDELVARITPGRPPVAPGNEAGMLGSVTHELADSFRVAVGLPASPDPGRRAPVVREPRAPGPDDIDRLLAATKAAAESVPDPDRLGQDFAVRHAVARAAADVRGLLAGEDRPAWRECQPGISPDAHLVSAYRWDGPRGRPLGFAERADELRRTLDAAGPPWCPSEARPVPGRSDDGGWVLYSRRQAMVTADLLDELAARLVPGRRTGTIHFSAYPLQQLVGTTVRAGSTDA